MSAHQRIRGGNKRTELVVKIYLLLEVFLSVSVVTRWELRHLITRWKFSHLVTRGSILLIREGRWSREGRWGTVRWRSIGAGRGKSRRSLSRRSLSRRSLSRRSLAGWPLSRRSLTGWSLASRGSLCTRRGERARGQEARRWAVRTREGRSVRARCAREGGPGHQTSPLPERNHFLLKIEKICSKG